MNERIRELAEQAGYEKDMFGVGHWDMPECKKFAELIVKECAGIYSKIDNGNLHMGTDNYLEALHKTFFEVEDTEEDSACSLCGEDGGTTCGMPGCQY